MKKRKITKILTLGIISFILLSCKKSEGPSEAIVGSKSKVEAQASALGPWGRVFTDDFTTSASLTNNWYEANRKDYNSDFCTYDPAVPVVANYDGKSVLVLTATKTGTNAYKSGFVKSNFTFKPGINEEYRVSASIKLIAMNGANYTSFSSTYGAWPAFWTVQETGWPTKGEIDIYEGYSYAGSTQSASNLFYGDVVGTSELGTTCKRSYTVSDGWHMYDEYWKNVNGTVTVTIQYDGVTVAYYTNAINGNLQLQNFGPHNIIFNLAIGDNYEHFDESRINLFSKVMMWVNYVTVDKRTL